MVQWEFINQGFLINTTHLPPTQAIDALSSSNENRSHATPLHAVPQCVSYDMISSAIPFATFSSCDSCFFPD